MSKSFHCIPRVYPVWVHSVQHILWCVCSFSSFRPPRPSRDVSIYLFPLPVSSLSSNVIAASRRKTSKQSIQSIQSERNVMEWPC
uniref:Uncharacterized protein n=1 Tax=Picea glauca TaxID=3330 RepID=A0A101LY92_PICGL|nr:hypothetical protein ABT39_MTgene5770 [Picea glauca]QHR90455.1 hypothetical protein Q903MT_gene4479 [Picea sitchensis]